MSLLLKHWQWVALAALVAAVALFIHERDQRLIAEGEARVYLQVADSLKLVSDSLGAEVVQADLRAEEAIQVAENIVASIEENRPKMEAATDSTLNMLRDTLPAEYTSMLDSLEVEIVMERAEHDREVAQLWMIIAQKDDQLDARDRQIASLQSALAAEIQARGGIQMASTGSWTEKALYAIGGAAVGFLVSEVRR